MRQKNESAQTEIADNVQACGLAGEKSIQMSSGSSIRSLFLFFAIVYAAEGFCEPRGLIGQPLIRFFKEQYSWSPTMISSYLSLFSLPWIIKPVFGIVSDYLPIFGYRRRSYLLLANLAAAIAYIAVSRLTGAGAICGALLVTFFGMAISSTVCGALLVENGQRLRMASALVNQQWLWLSIAAILSSLGGGWLAQHLPLATAVHAAALVLLCWPLAVGLLGIFLVVEKKTTLNRTETRETLSAFWLAIRSGRFLAIAVFLFLYMYSPGFYVPLYFHMTNQLHFSQQFIGVLGSINSAGGVAGAVLHRFVLRHIGRKRLVNLSILLGVLAALAYLVMLGRASAVTVYCINGMVGTITIIVSATLAAEFCPPRSEGFAYAILATMENLAIRLSDVSGSYFYDHFFHRQLVPLVWVSAGFTALAFAFVPMLRLNQRDVSAGEPIGTALAG